MSALQWERIARGRAPRRSPNESWYTEVKGTRSLGTSVSLTKNEVNFAQANGDRMVLFIVHFIDVEPHKGTFRTVGGEHMVFQPWRLSAGVLVATSYVYAP